MAVIRIADDLFRRLQKHANPLVDSVNDVLRRVLDGYEGLNCVKSASPQIEGTQTRGHTMPVTLSFSPWTAWGGRDHLEDTALPGLYLLARFDGTPPGDVDPLAQEVMFIGVTEKQTLRKRWEQFAASAFRQQVGHSGGWTFNSRYCGSKTCNPPPWLYVAAMPVAKEEVATIRPLKRQLLSDFTGRWGALPACNIRS